MVNTNKADQQQQVEWLTSFIVSNGFETLYLLFLNWEHDSNSQSQSVAIRKQCLQSLLKLITSFIMGMYGVLMLVDRVSCTRHQHKHTSDT
jgi:hypothetical protein